MITTISQTSAVRLQGSPAAGKCPEVDVVLRTEEILQGPTRCQ